VITYLALTNYDVMEAVASFNERCRVVIDKDGFRPNVGIILCNDNNEVLWAQRAQHDSWQFPQGGIKVDETPEQAVYRELMEEVGLAPEHVELLGMTSGWLRYRLPKRYLRYGNKPLCIGQKQRWFLLRLTGSESDVNLTRHDKPEFDDWRWENYWQPAKEIVFFKRRVYEKALHELAPLLFPEYKKRIDNQRKY
jgi:putative (di)nucleoside polyphosphate hydrolase